MIDKVFKFAQNKNTIMLLTAMSYMLGLFGYFSGHGILFFILITVLAVILIIKTPISPKMIIFWVLIFYFGFLNSSLRIKNSDALFDVSPLDTKLVGQIVSVPNTAGVGKLRFFFKTDKPVKGKTLVTVVDNEENFSDFNIGGRYEVTAKVRRPFKVGNPSQFDYGKYLRNFGAYTVSYAEVGSCERLNEKISLRWQFLQELNKFRNNILSVHARYLKTPNLEILGGIVFGDDAVAPPDYIKASFVNSGLLHILAASGMNVAIIFSFWFWILSKLRVPYKLTISSGIAVIILYSMMTGFGAAVIRATIMLVFILIGKLIDRDTHSVALLAFVALLMLVYNPAYINDIGFQLSFLVTLGLLTTASVVQPYLKCIPSLFSGALIIPVVAQIWVIPLQMFYFNTISTYSIFANILSVPFLTIISFGGFLSSILAAFKPLADTVCMWMDFVLNWFLSILVLISDFFAGLPHSLFVTTHPSVYQVVCYYIIVLLATLMIKIGFNKKVFALICAIAILIGVLSIKFPSKNLEIIAFDVQNADCFLVKTPKGRYFMIDSGKSGYQGGASQAKFIVIKYLKDIGVKELEGLILTHFDNDHAGGAPDLINELKIKKVYLKSLNGKNYTTQKVYNAINAKRTSAIIPAWGEEIYKEGNLNLKTFALNLGDEKFDNENSIMTLLTYGDFDMLFAGDAGKFALSKVSAELPAELEVFKVGHHGAKDVVSREFLEKFNVKTSIISTGPNTFGHPNPATIGTLRETKIFRTDRNNAIKILSDGIKYKVLTFDSQKHRFIDYK